MTAERAESGHLRAVAVDAATAVGPYLREAFRAPMHVSTKRDAHDLVTEHDRESEERITERLLAALPGSRVLGEEGGSRGSSEARVEWHVDPIDGTVNFAAGIAFWCVSVAAAVEGVVVAGAIHDPMSGAVFSADLGGASLDGSRLAVNGSPAESEAMVVSSFPGAIDLDLFGPAALEACEELLGAVRTLRSMGSGALGLAHVAAGWADATFDLNTNPWDVAAGSLILQQAGGRYVGFDRGRPVAGPDAYRQPCYVGSGRAEGYPTLERMVAGLSQQR